jgi:hypothetical protein
VVGDEGRLLGLIIRSRFSTTTAAMAASFIHFVLTGRSEDGDGDGDGADRDGCGGGRRQVPWLDFVVLTGMWPYKCLGVSPADAGVDGWFVGCQSSVATGLRARVIRPHLFILFYFIYSSPPLSPTCTRTDDVLQRSQCQRRALVCEYPAESRRGMRKKKALPEGESFSSLLHTVVSTLSPNSR